MTRFALSPEQAEELEVHFGEILHGDELRRAVTAIDLAASVCQTWHAPGDRRRELAGEAERMAELAHACARLRELLSQGHPIARLDWSALDVTLRALSVAAERDAKALRPKAKRGAPPDAPRDELIAVIHSVYPKARAPWEWRVHFERTVEMVLGFVGRDVEDVHGLIGDALRRQPTPPFRIR